jgi:proline iminopeptidase
MEAEMRRAAVDDVEIAYWRVGKGASLVTVHGGPGIGHRYLRPLDAWADEFEVVYYDHRGSGYTEVGDTDKVSFSGGIADLDGLRRHLGIDRINLVGHSFGAILALLYAAKHPEETGSLVLLNPAPPFVPELAQQLGKNMAVLRTPADDAEKEALETSEAFAARDPKTLERHTLNAYTPFFTDRSWRDAADLGFTEITAANILAAGDRTFRDLGQLDPVGALATVACPTLVVHSERDPVPEEFSRILADKIASAEYQLISDAAHFVHLEDPATLAAAVKPFLGNNVG